ncbi:hypothetical protein WBP06_01505 [Novosphingobium sp. BL-8H]|uniref:hypothetical protein n=1 Tax=Novosphingobium sp. BL-8H TaxID=3127640 RepID=UPI003756CF27
MKNPTFEVPHAMAGAAPPNAATSADGGIATAYIVHDLADAAVRRRIGLLRSAGAAIRLAGFHRTERAPAEVEGLVPQPLGHTRDGALLARIVTVARQWLAPARLRRVTGGAQVIVARNLETLVLAARLRQRGQRLVYECLDIHRLLLGAGLASHLLRMVETWAMRHVDLVVVSAPAFRDRYFRERRGWKGPIALVENLVPATGMPPEARPPLPDPSPAPPWRIGWFGMLRCRRSLDMLCTLAKAHPGMVEVLIAGRPSPDIFPDLAAEIAAAPGVTFVGAYSAEDLPQLYGQVHFAWAIDYFEEGLNSAWLLPNRLYESLAHGAVPIALAQVATGEWLESHGAGMLTTAPERQLPDMFAMLSPEILARLRQASARIPATAVVMDAAQARAIGRNLLGLAG